MNESDIENAAIDLLQAKGYTYISGSLANAHRGSTKDVVLKDCLE